MSRASIWMACRMALIGLALSGPGLGVAKSAGGAAKSAGEAAKKASSARATGTVAAPGRLTVSSAAFGEQKYIPVKYSCDGSNVSPPLAWTAGPVGTQSYALIVDDPDAPYGTFTHWVFFNIPASVTQLPERVWSSESLGGEARQGSNDFPNLGYGGPCPPHGLHHYHFKVYALDTRLELPAGSRKVPVQKAMAGHVLAEGRLVGLYEHRPDKPGAK